MDFGRRRWVLDGGLATEIEKRGIKIQDDPLWSARLLYTDPDVIVDIHKSYLQHGADIITTASYQASVDGFCRVLSISQSEALDLIGRSVALATKARTWFLDQGISETSDRVCPLIAGSVGPYGACQHDGSEYHGSYVEHMTTEELVAFHRPRVAKLLKEGVDILACETIPAKAEGEAIVKLLQEFPSAKAWISFSCKDGESTCHGDSFPEAVSSMSSSPQVMAVGVNCSNPKYVESLLQSAQGTTDKPFVVYPNSGEEWSREAGWEGNSGSYTACIARWIQLGAGIIGGCCRIGPREIEELRKFVYETPQVANCYSPSYET